MNKIPDCADMILQLFRKGQCFSHKSGHPLPQREIEPFDMIRFPTFLSHRLMPFCGEYRIISRPEICISDGALAVNRRQRIPQAFGTYSITVSDEYAYDFSRIDINRKPNPLFITLFTDEGPHFITFYCQPPFCFYNINFMGYFLVFSIDIFLQPRLGNPSNSRNTRYRYFGLDHRFGHLRSQQ